MVTDVSEERTIFTFSVEDGGDIFLRNVGNHLQDYITQKTTTYNTSSQMLGKPIGNIEMYSQKNTFVFPQILNVTVWKIFKTKFININEAFVLQ
jgi:hypothetical protein